MVRHAPTGEDACRSTERGVTLIEVVVVLAIFGVFLIVITILTSEMRSYEKRMPVNFMTHPQISAVVSRLRHDVWDTTAPYYPAAFDRWTQGPATLLLDVLQPDGTSDTIVYDFSNDGEVTRHQYRALAEVSVWTAHATPTFKILDFPIAGKPDSVRIQAYDQDGKLAIDQIFQPRPHPN
jgi:prepilin-type N-terminal cleavage/methylation domain-containing protein